MMCQDAASVLTVAKIEPISLLYSCASDEVKGQIESVLSDAAFGSIIVAFGLLLVNFI